MESDWRVSQVFSSGIQSTDSQTLFVLTLAHHHNLWGKLVKNTYLSLLPRSWRPGFVGTLQVMLFHGLKTTGICQVFRVSPRWVRLVVCAQVN